MSDDKKRFLRFAVVGASGVAVNMGVLALALWGLSPRLEGSSLDFAAAAIATVISIMTNFLLNDLWTWGDREKGSRKRDFLGRMGAYYLGASVAAGLSLGAFAFASTVLGLGVYLAQLIGIGLGTVVNYVINNRLVFKDATPDAGPDVAAEPDEGNR
jgi:putative flippase GtrA